MGFPSPANDYIEDRISLDKLCILRPSSTYFMKAADGSPQHGILPDSLLVVDRARTPVDGSVVVADVGGEHMLCMLQLYPSPALKKLATQKVVRLLTEDSFSDDAAVIFGVVSYSVNSTTCFEFDDRPCM